MYARKGIQGLVLMSILWGAIFVIAEAVCAHQVYLFAWVEGDTVYTESYFGGKRKVAGGEIRVYGPSGKELVTGQTDEQGAFSFPIPQRTDLRIVLGASMGHQAEYLLEASEIGEQPVEKVEETLPRDNQGTSDADPDEAVAPAEGALDKESLRILVEDALDKRLKPISRSLARLEHEQGPGVTEVLGGLGYILGLMGIYLYGRSRKNRKDRT